MKDLTVIRDEIDGIDRQILSLYEERLKLADEVADYKIANHKNVFDKEREEQKLNVLSKLASDDFSRQGIIELFEQIMSTSRKKQYGKLAEHDLIERIPFECVDSFDFNNKTIVFQGVEGAYTQMALKEFFGEDNDSYHVNTWREAMEAVKNHKADYAVLPIENSTAGVVAENYDLLAEYNAAIIGEQIIKIDHALLGVKGATIEEVTCVFSHPQALMQCAGYLEEQHPNFEKISMKNTAMSAQKIRNDGKKNQAAIAGEINASLYDLDILERCIQDDQLNETRFIIVSRDKVYHKDAGKISLTFEIPHQTGSLYHILSHFIFNGVNMTKIESRPLKGKNWEYRFFIDLEGNLKEEGVRNALRGLNEETIDLKLLGNY